jgi:hypothetical protein
MKPIAIILLLLAASCGTGRKITGITEGRLKEVHPLPGGRDSLVLKDRKDSTLIFMNTTTRPANRRYIIGDWYTIKADSTRYRNTGGKKWVAASIRHSN